MELLDRLNTAFILVTQPATAAATRMSKYASHSTRKYKFKFKIWNCLVWLNANAVSCLIMQ